MRHDVSPREAALALNDLVQNSLSILNRANDWKEKQHLCQLVSQFINSSTASASTSSQSTGVAPMDTDIVFQCRTLLQNGFVYEYPGLLERSGAGGLFAYLMLVYLPNALESYSVVFSVRTSANAAIRLCPEKDEKDEKDAYEIVLGGWDNQKTVSSLEAISHLIVFD